jgi:hypothetical protein
MSWDEVFADRYEEAGVRLDLREGDMRDLALDEPAGQSPGRQGGGW